MRKIVLYDTTLRDGIQGEGVSLSAKDKLAITRKLDELGIRFIEGGNPGSNPKDIEFFRAVRKLKLRNAMVCAFGSTRRKNKTVRTDPGLKALLSAHTDVVTIFGKSWILHVKDVLRVTLKDNLDMIASTVEYLKFSKKEVIYDAEHFFDGYRDNPDYALKTVKAAEEAGADWIVLCDTNGGNLPHFVREVVEEVSRNVSLPLGIHTHNDSGMAAANSVAAVLGGVRQVQGTINGYGERCGNADLCSIIPVLKWKLNIDCITDKRSKKLVEVSRYVSELANVVPRNEQPFVGDSAFAHKGGMHVDAVRKNPKSFEHMEPGLIGNERRILVSELSGRGNVVSKAAEYGFDAAGDPDAAKKIVDRVKELEHQGYHFEAADASLQLLMKRVLGVHRSFFELQGFRVSVERRDDDRVISEATIKVKVKGVVEHTAAEGDGPVNALDGALRKALERFYPNLREMRLTDFKVRVLDASAGTAAKVRVLVESRDHTDNWRTVGVSENIIVASWRALVDSVEYKLMKDQK
jgi:2-isopropylmalate synthase